MPSLETLRKSKIGSFFRSRSNSPSGVSRSPFPAVSEKNIGLELSTGIDTGLSLEQAEPNLSTSSSVAEGVIESPEQFLLPVPALRKTFSVDHWKYAILLLNDWEKEQLRIPSDGAESGSILADLQRLTAEKQKQVQDKAWKINFRGRRIALKDILAKIASCLKSFETIGDYIVSLDPGHAALPWAAIKVLLQVGRTKGTTVPLSGPAH
jgi:hypothetical protein